MAFIRVKRRSGQAYAYLVANERREDGEPRQRVLRYLGRADAVTPRDVPFAQRHDEAVGRWLESHRAEATREHRAEEAALRRQLRTLLLAGDRKGARGIVEASVASLGAWDFMDSILVPLQREVGDDWHEGRLTVAQEHAVSSAVAGILFRLREEAYALGETAPAQGRLTVLLANAAGEAHALALEMLECRLAAAGHRTILSAGGTPRRDLASRAAEVGADLVLVSTTMPEHASEALAAARAVLERQDALVALGGQAWTYAGAPRDADPRIRLVDGPVGPALDALVEECRERRDARARAA